MAKTEIISQPFATNKSFGNNNCFCKLVDGTMLQWGTLSDVTVDVSTALPSGMYGGEYIFTLPEPFFDTNYTVTGGFQYGTGGVFPIAVRPNSKGRDNCAFTLLSHQAVSGDRGRINWLAIGRWK